MPPAALMAMEEDENRNSSSNRRRHNEQLDDAVLRHLQRHPPQSHQNNRSKTTQLSREPRQRSPIEHDTAPLQQQQQTCLHQSLQSSSLSATVAPAPPNKPIRRTILPSRSKTKLMRQVSALGMEDPVFRTTEQGPPHHPSNIYDDMGLTHLPVDMMDMVSVASDPTATLHEGFLDMTLFQSLATNSFLLESSAAALHSLNNSSLLHGVANAAPAPVSPEPMILSSTTNNNAACPMDIVTTTRPTSSRENVRGSNVALDITAPVLVPNRSRNNTAIMTSHWNHHPATVVVHAQQQHTITTPSLSLSSSPIKSEATRSQASHASSYLPHHNRKERGASQPCEPMGASLPSLDLDAVFAHHVVASSTTTTTGTTVPVVSSTTPHPHNTDLLLAEAAQALEEQGGHDAGCAALIQAAKRQQHPPHPYHHKQHKQYHHRHHSTAAAAAATHHVSCSTLKHTSTAAQTSRCSSTHKASRRHSTGVVPIVFDVETAGTTTNTFTSSSSSSRSRCLPTLESLFPDASARTAAAAVVAMLPPIVRTDSSDSNFSLLMLSGPPLSSRRFARRSSAHGGLSAAVAAHATDNTATASKW
jgi:hypothetical protein